MSTLTIKQNVKNIAATGSNLLEAAEGCRAANFTAQQCAPELYNNFPSTSANDLAAVLVDVWACELSSSDLSAALTSCQNDGSSAYSASEISDAVSTNLTLEYLDVANVPTQYGGGTNNQLKMIGLAQGNLVTTTAAEGARFLIISCLPGSYSRTPGSMIAALYDAYGIDVGSLAESPAADYLSDLTSPTGVAIPYQQLLVLETSGQDAVANIPGLFTAIKKYIPNPPVIPDTGPTILSDMVSTGSAGAGYIQVLEALFNGAYDLMTARAGYNMTCFRMVNYTSSWSASLTSEFNQLKSAQGL